MDVGWAGEVAESGHGVLHSTLVFLGIGEAGGGADCGPPVIGVATGLGDQNNRCLWAQWIEEAHTFRWAANVSCDCNRKFLSLEKNSDRNRSKEEHDILTRII
jgi:hypothetical protein